MSIFRKHDDVYRTPCSTSKKEREFFNCDYCDEGGWISETDVEIHTFDKHKKIIYSTAKDDSKIVCQTCFKLQPDRETLLKHIKSIHLLSSESAIRIEREIFVCDHCNHIFFNKLLLQSHIERVHDLIIKKKKGSKPLTCPKCLKKISWANIWCHLEYHRLKSVSVCPICMEKMVNTREVKEHLKKHMKHLHCDVCQYNTLKDSYFNEHVKTHKHRTLGINKKSRNYFIPKNITKLSPSTILKGLILCNNIKICILCREICVNREAMDEHVSVHCPIVEKKKNYNCVCGMGYLNSILLKQHLFKQKGHRALGENESMPSTCEENT